MSYRDNPIKTVEIGNHRISIYYDEDAGCPTREWDMGGSYLWESLSHHQYWLDDRCDYQEWCTNPRNESVESLLQVMAADKVEQSDIIKFVKDGNVDDVRLIYNRSEKFWELQHRCAYGANKGEWDTDYEIEPGDLKKYDYKGEFLEMFEEDDLIKLIQKYAKDFVIKAWSSSGYCQGDHMRGVAYMSKAQFDKRCGFNSKKYKTWEEQALAVMKSEIKCLEIWAWGDVKGFVLEEKVPFVKTYEDGEMQEDFEWEEIDSCWGFYLTTDELIKEVINDHGLKENAA